MSIAEKLKKEESKKELPVTAEKKTDKRLKLYVIIASAVLSALVTAAAVFIIVCIQPVTVEVCDIPDYSHITEKPVVNFFCKIKTELSEVDTKSPGEVPIKMQFFGFIKINAKAVVVDTQAPEITQRKVCITPDAPLKAEMFAKTVNDRTNVTFEFTNSAPDTGSPGEYTVSILAKDEGKNTKKFTSTLIVTEEREDFSFEYGTSTDIINEHILSQFSSVASLDLSKVEDCGTFSVTGENSDTFFLFEITITDTVPPKAEIMSFDILLGDTVSDSEIVTSITDFSKVTTEFLSRPDFSLAGEHEVKILLTDEYGNSADYTSYIRIHDINTDITVEAKSQNSTLADLIFKDSFSREALSFSAEHITRDMPLGENSASLSGKYNSIPVTLNMIDTVPPEFSTKTVYKLVGNRPSAYDFVSSCYDTTKVTYSFKEAPDHNTEGTFEITVIATDLAGNTSERTATAVFFVDRTPPVISGLRDLSVIIGEAPAYLKGVSAYDEVWGNIKVTVDHSAADLKTAGTYEIKYSASDKSGNTAVEAVTLTVREPIRVCLDVENILQKPALPNGCEVVSLAIALRYAGHSVDPVFLYDTYMPRSPYKDGDPWTTYVGNAKGKGLGCYAPCVAETGNKFLSEQGSSKRVYDVSGQSVSAYEKYIDNGTPVIMWGMLNMNGSSKVFWRDTVNGKSVVWHYYSHCLVMIGYTDYTYIFCDPLKGIVEYDKDDVEKSFNNNFKQACVVQ